MNNARYLMIFVACASLAGCTSSAGSAEEVGESREAWAETTCGDATACGQEYSGEFCSQSFGIQSELFWSSPDRSYGYSGCTHGFIVEVTVQAQSYAAAGWDDTLPTNQADCENSGVTMIVRNTVTGASFEEDLTGGWASGFCTLDTTPSVVIPAGATVNIISVAYTYTWVSTPVLHKVYSYKLVQPTVYL